ncbi:MAG: hypothetical protein LBS20_19620 [Prevotella sp.]|nr:hypothetical protein [Prevotella sp.]
MVCIDRQRVFGCCRSNRTAILTGNNSHSVLIPPGRACLDTGRQRSRVPYGSNLVRVPLAADEQGRR